MNPISRREFASLVTAGVVIAPEALRAIVVHPAGISAQDVVDRIKQNIGVAWQTDTVDKFKAGNPESPLKGIAVTSMATLAVLRQAVQAGANLVITAEPTFFSKADTQTVSGGRRGGPPPAPDAILKAKNEFIEKNGLIIWRFSDHWRQRKPNPFAVGLTDKMNWSRFRRSEDPARITMPATTLTALASDIKKKLNARGGIRVIGDPQLRVQNIGLLPGTTPIQEALRLLPSVDALIAGEVREWESVEYVRDKVTAGEKKSLILLGRVVSEDPGMNVCASWLKTIVPEVRTTWLPVGDPYWRPA